MAVFMRSPPIALFEAEFWMMRTDHFFGIWIAEQPFREVVEVMDSAGVNEGSNYWSQGYSGQTTEHQGAESRGNDFDVDFSYWDLKLHAALGHLLKDFDGAVSFDELGPRCGGYGSFLPVQQCSPSVLRKPRRTAAVQNYSSENFLNEGTVEQVTCSVSGVTSTKMMSLADKNPPGSGALAPDFENELLLAANAVKDNDPPPVKIPLIVNDVKDNSRKKLKVRFKKASDSVS